MKAIKEYLKELVQRYKTLFNYFNIGTDGKLQGDLLQIYALSLLQRNKSKNNLLYETVKRLVSDGHQVVPIKYVECEEFLNKLDLVMDRCTSWECISGRKRNKLSTQQSDFCNECWVINAFDNVLWKDDANIFSNTGKYLLDTLDIFQHQLKNALKFNANLSLKTRMNLFQDGDEICKVLERLQKNLQQNSDLVKGHIIIGKLDKYFGLVISRNNVQFVMNLFHQYPTFWHFMVDEKLFTKYLNFFTLMKQTKIKLGEIKDLKDTGNCTIGICICPNNVLECLYAKDLEENQSKTIQYHLHNEQPIEIFNDSKNQKLLLQLIPLVEFVLNLSPFECFNINKERIFKLKNETCLYNVELQKELESLGAKDVKTQFDLYTWLCKQYRKLLPSHSISSKLYELSVKRKTFKKPRDIDTTVEKFCQYCGTMKPLKFFQKKRLKCNKCRADCRVHIFSLNDNKTMVLFKQLVSFHSIMNEINIASKSEFPCAELSDCSFLANLLILNMLH